MNKPFAILLLFTVLFVFCVALYAGRAPYIVDDILNPAKSEDNSRAITENFKSLYEQKVSVSSATGARYTITDIADPEQAEENAFTLNELFKDAWTDLVEISGSTGTPRFIIADLDRPELADDNAAGILENFEDLWTAKEDK